MDKEINEIVECITTSKEYIECIKIKEKMNQNKALLEKVENIKKLQQEYVKTNKEEVKEKLDLLEE